MGALWGYAEDGDPEEGHASRVIVQDALIATTCRTGPDGLPLDHLDPDALPVRHGVGIDRVTGAAASGILYARTVVPRGHYLRLELDVELAGDEAGHQRDRARLGVLLTALSAKEIRLGAAGSRGFGVVSLLASPLDVHEHDFTCRDGLLALLGGRSKQLALTDLNGEEDLPHRRDVLTVRIAWRPAAPVMVRAVGGGESISTVPLTTRITDEAVALTLPGSAIKGALRSHAEFIERTAREQDAPALEEGGAASEHTVVFRAQLDELPAVKALFGTANRQDSGSSQLGISALRAEECVSTSQIPADVWRVVLEGPAFGEPPSEDNGKPAQAAGKVEDRAVLPADIRARLHASGLDQADHVAIDRWTGGSADKLLFSVLEPHDVAWEDIRLTVDLTRLGAGDHALALLLLVLRDMHQQRVPLGGMVTRGFGDIDVESITLTGGKWPEGTTLDRALDAPALAEAWRTYVESPL